MITVNAEVKRSPEAWKFFHETKSRLEKGVKFEQLHFSISLKSFIGKDKRFFSYGYTLINEWLTRVVGFILFVVIAIFKGVSPWLILPAGILLVEYFIGLVGFWLLYRGLRRAGYKGPIKLISDKQFIVRGVHNGTS